MIRFDSIYNTGFVIPIFEGKNEKENVTLL